MTIRPFRDSDYHLIASVWNEAYPMYPSHPDEIRHDDVTRRAHIYWRRYLLEQSGEILGFGVVKNAHDSFHPQEFWLALALRPRALGRGHGRALFERLVTDIEAKSPRALFAWAREDMPRALRFYHDRGFFETQRSFQSVLDVAAFDGAPFSDNHARLAEHGIEIRDLNALQSDPDHRRKLYLLHTEIDRDVPMTGSYNKPSFEAFCDAHFNERLLADGLLVAMHGDGYIGMCEIYRTKGSDDLHNGLTGVLRPWRRKGVALGLKLASIEVARRHGVAAIRTWNAAHNHPMLAINEILGFVKLPATIDYKRSIDVDERV